MAAIGQQARFRRASPCPICGGGDDLPRGQGRRCSGFLSSDGRFAFCTREEHAGQAAQEQTDPPSWRHILEGECRCGATHREAPPAQGVEYDYRDAAGTLTYQVVRLPGKQFRQRRPAPDGSWLWNLDGVTRVLYRLPQILAAASVGETIYVVEGEKDVHAVEKAGGVATCNPGGAGKWKPHYALALAGSQPVIVADNDPAGIDHALRIAESLPGAPLMRAAAGKDVSDHLAAGHSLGALLPLILNPPGEQEQIEPPSAITDLENAIRLVEQHGASLRYCDPWGRWLFWDGLAWAEDTTRHLDALAQEVVRGLLAEAAQIADEKLRSKTLREVRAAEKQSRLRGTVEAARARPGIPIKPEQLDADPWLFNCAGGTIDLRSGACRAPVPADLISKCSPAAYHPAAEAPAWHAFLERVLPDPAIRQFLQRAAGYSLAGGNPAQILLILWGSGANGKSTFIEALRRLFGPYGQQAPPDLFLARREGIPNDVARLRGARFVACTEIGEGRRLNEPLIKRMTGGDTMTARFLHAEFFEFEPQFTPWLATNHRPEIRGTDEAIWRRISLVPFLEYIPPAERDETLKDKLAAELPGILRWALAGCAAWQADGLADPPAVQAATAEYRQEQDLLGAFLAEACDEDPAAHALSGPLYAAYHQWAKAAGLEPISARALGLKLGERGFQHIKSGRGRGWRGLRLHGADEHLTT